MSTGKSKPAVIRSGLPRAVKVVEVGPRDGLQNEAVHLSVERRVHLIKRLHQCGFNCIEIGSLVSPARVPRMAHSDRVFRQLDTRTRNASRILLANERGLEQALGLGIREIAVICAASEAFSMRNTGCGMEQGLRRCESLCSVAQAHGIQVRGYISCAFGCPLSGPVDPDQVVQTALRLHCGGCYEVALADTSGQATPRKARRLIERVARAIPLPTIAVHFHDTRGQALANTRAALQAGVNIIDSALGGLGGCPFAGNAGGNLASEELVSMLDGLGMDCGIDLNRLTATAVELSAWLGRAPASARAQTTVTEQHEFFDRSGGH